MSFFKKTYLRLERPLGFFRAAKFRDSRFSHVSHGYIAVVAKAGEGRQCRLIAEIAKCAGGKISYLGVGVFECFNQGRYSLRSLHDSE